MKSLAILLICAVCLQLAMARDSHESTEGHDSHEDFMPLPGDGLEVPFGGGSSSNCGAPRNKGLHHLMDKAEDLLPKDRFKSIVRSAVRRDPEVRRLRDLLRSPNFRQLAREVRNSREMRAVREFACRRMYFKLSDLAEFLRDVIQFDTLVGRDNSGELINVSPGIGGMLKDLGNELPKDRIRDLVDRLSRDDRYLQEGLRQLKSPEFERIMQRFREQPQYTEMRRQLRAVGVPRGEIKKLLEQALGIDLGFMNIEHM